MTYRVFEDLLECRLHLVGSEKGIDHGAMRCGVANGGKGAMALDVATQTQNIDYFFEFWLFSNAWSLLVRICHAVMHAFVFQLS